MIVDLGTSNFSKIILNAAYRIIGGVKESSPMVPVRHNAANIIDGQSLSFGLGANVGNSASLSVTFTKNGQ